MSAGDDYPAFENGSVGIGIGVGVGVVVGDDGGGRGITSDEYRRGRGGGASGRNGPASSREAGREVETNATEDDAVDDDDNDAREMLWMAKDPRLRYQYRRRTSREAASNQQQQEQQQQQRRDSDERRLRGRREELIGGKDPRLRHQQRRQQQQRQQQQQRDSDEGQLRGRREELIRAKDPRLRHQQQRQQRQRQQIAGVGETSTDAARTDLRSFESLRRAKDPSLRHRDASRGTASYRRDAVLPAATTTTTTTTAVPMSQRREEDETVTDETVASVTGRGQIEEYEELQAPADQRTAPATSGSNAPGGEVSRDGWMASKRSHADREENGRNDDNDNNKKRIRRFIALFVCFLLVVIALSVVLAMLLGRDDENEGVPSTAETTAPPTPTPPPPPPEAILPCAGYGSVVHVDSDNAAADFCNATLRENTAYVMTSSVSCRDDTDGPTLSRGTCLDCSGHNIGGGGGGADYASSSFSVGVYIPLPRAAGSRVHNCSVSNFYDGVRIRGDDHPDDETAVEEGGAAVVVVVVVSYTALFNNTASGITSSQEGDRSYTADVLCTMSAYNGNDGIRTGGEAIINITGSVVSSNKDVGIVSASDTRLSHSLVQSNINGGMLVLGSHEREISGATFIDNGPSNIDFYITSAGNTSLSDVTACGTGVADADVGAYDPASDIVFGGGSAEIVAFRDVTCDTIRLSSTSPNYDQDDVECVRGCPSSPLVPAELTFPAVGGGPPIFPRNNPFVNDAVCPNGVGVYPP